MSILAALTQAPPTNETEWSVGDLAAALRRTLEDAFGHVRLRGEISGYRGQHGSGHAYFSLKDGNARIDAVVWKGTFNRLRQKPKEGLEVVATGKITTFAGKSSYQIVIESLEPAGIGAWMALLEERKRVLAAEGLFAPEAKRPIPYLPGVVGVVTSPTGAVIRDILHRLEDRFPRHVLVWPVRVQGEGAADEVAAAIRGFNALAPGGPIPRPDVLIVARGGGSIEDLWAFNEEAVVRAAFASTIPLISAVGHETDTTLIDHVADRRAPTPTGAAEMAVPVRADLMAQVDDLGRRRSEAILRRLDRERTDLRALLRAMPNADAFLAAKRQRLDLAEARLIPALAGNARVYRDRFGQVLERLSRHPPELGLARAKARLAAIDHRPRTAMLHRIERGGDTLAALGRLLGSLGYKAVLARGYALVRDEAGAPLRSVAGLTPGRRLHLELADGTVRVRTEDAGTEGGEEPAPKAKRAPRRTLTREAGQDAAREPGRGRKAVATSQALVEEIPAPRQGSLF
jgi:exodeoxyribonuclease VII large subunit